MFKIFNGVLTGYIHEKNETDIIIPDNVTIISEKVFCDCRTIKSVTLPKNVTRIEASSFSGCSSLEHIRLSEELVYIGENAFHACTKLREITFPDSLSYIGDRAFYGCKLIKKIHFSPSLSVIGDRAFMACMSLKEATFVNNLDTIGSKAFANTLWLESKRNENPLVKISGIVIDGYKIRGTLVLTDDISGVSESAFDGNQKIEKVILHSEKYEIGLHISVPEDIETVIRLININENQQRIMLQQIDDEQLKTQIAMFLAFGKNCIVGEEYLQNNILNVSKSFISTNDTAHFRDILNSKFITNSNISEILRYASEENNTEIKALLIEYQNKVIGFSSVHDRFKL